MRQTFDNLDDLSITIEDEIEYLKSYISIQNQNFENRIKYSIQVDPKIDISETKIPTMLLQIFVENVFKHAFAANHEQPRFQIEFLLLDNNLLKITIEDNGTGNKNVSKTHISKGIQKAKECIEILQPKNTNPIAIHFSEKGTTVTIHLLV